MLFFRSSCLIVYRAGLSNQHKPALCLFYNAPVYTPVFLYRHFFRLGSTEFSGGHGGNVGSRRYTIPSEIFLVNFSEPLAQSVSYQNPTLTAPAFRSSLSQAFPLSPSRNFSNLPLSASSRTSLKAISSLLPT